MYYGNRKNCDKVDDIFGVSIDTTTSTVRENKLEMQ